MRSQLHAMVLLDVTRLAAISNAANCLAMTKQFLNHKHCTHKPERGYNLDMSLMVGLGSGWQVR